MNEYDTLPQHIKDIVDSWDDNKDLYQECSRIKCELEINGYTCDYGLDGQVYDIKPLNKQTTMKKLMKHEVGSLTNGTYKTNTLSGVTYYELFNILGQPTYDHPSEDNKTQVEWVIEWEDEVYTIYDWKTYNREYTINELNTWSIRSKVPSYAFEEALINLIDKGVVDTFKSNINL